MKRGKQLLASLLVMMLAAGLLQAPAVNMMPVFAAEAETMEAESVETDGNEGTAETSPMGGEKGADVIEDTSGPDCFLQPPFAKRGLQKTG